jgi:hypothetical protein
MFVEPPLDGRAGFALLAKVFAAVVGVVEELPKLAVFVDG